MLTELAAKEIRNIVSQNELKDDTVFLRVGVKGGGCSGFSYVLDLTENKRDSDEEFEQHGIILVCDPKSLLYLDGVTIDVGVCQDEHFQAAYLVHPEM